MAKTFIEQVTRIHDSVESVQKVIATLLEETKQGKVFLEECRIDKGSHRTSIRISYWKNGEHAERS